MLVIRKQNLGGVAITRLARNYAASPREIPFAIFIFSCCLNKLTRDDCSSIGSLWQIQVVFFIFVFVFCIKPRLKANKKTIWAKIGYILLFKIQKRFRAVFANQELGLRLLNFFCFFYNHTFFVCFRISDPLAEILVSYKF